MATTLLTDARFIHVLFRLSITQPNSLNFSFNIVYQKRTVLANSIYGR